MNNKDNHPKTNMDSFKQCLKGRWSDRILLILLLFGSFIVWFQVQHRLTHGAPTAYIYHGDQLLATYLLPTDERVLHVSARGEIGESEIEISKQGIRIKSSPCSTHYCTLSGYKSHAGSIIACVPNHIMAVLRGSVSKNEKDIPFDAVSE